MWSRFENLEATFEVIEQILIKNLLFRPHCSNFFGLNSKLKDQRWVWNTNFDEKVWHQCNTTSRLLRLFRWIEIFVTNQWSHVDSNFDYVSIWKHAAWFTYYYTEETKASVEFKWRKRKEEITNGNHSNACVKWASFNWARC